MLLNLGFQLENNGVSHWKHGKVRKETVSRTFRNVLQCTKHGFQHTKRYAEHVRNIDFACIPVSQHVTTCREYRYNMLRTPISTLQQCFRNVANTVNCTGTGSFAIEYTCKTERKHGNEHGT